MEWLAQILGDNWQPILVAIAVITTAGKAAWNEWQRRRVMQHGKKTAKKEAEINEAAYKESVDGIQELNESKESKLAETEQSMQVLKNALEEKKQNDIEDLKSNREELLNRLAKITGAKRVK
jgi:biopolymer transport protein ExbB/TolQ